MSGNCISISGEPGEVLIFNGDHHATVCGSIGDGGDPLAARKLVSGQLRYGQSRKIAGYGPEVV